MSNAKLNLVFGNAMGKNHDAVVRKFFHRHGYYTPGGIQVTSFRPTDEALTLSLQRGITALRNATGYPVELCKKAKRKEDGVETEVNTTVLTLSQNNVPIEIYEMDSNDFLAMDASRINWRRGYEYDMGSEFLMDIKIHQPGKLDINGKVLENFERENKPYDDFTTSTKKRLADIGFLRKRGFGKEFITGEAKLVSDVQINLHGEGDIEYVQELGDIIKKEMQLIGFYIRNS